MQVRKLKVAFWFGQAWAGSLAALALLPGFLAAGTVAVATGIQNQVIQGFGASSYGFNGPYSTAIANTLWTDDSNKALGSQSNGNPGLSILRLSIDENNSFGGEGQIAQQALGINPGVEVFASSWSPPAAYKNNNNINGNNTGNSNFNPGTNTNTIKTANLSNFATYQASFAQAMKNNYGFTLYAISPQNEPDYDTSYDSCLWTPQQFDQYVPLLSAALKNVGLGAVRIMLPESFADNLAGCNTTMADPAAAPDVSIIGMHLYGSNGNWTTLPASYAATAGHAVQGWVTEMSDFSTPTQTGMTGSGGGIHYAQQIHSTIVNGGLNAYCYWWLVLPTYGSNDDESLMLNNGTGTSRLYIMGNYSKFIRPGYHLVGALNAANNSPQTGVQVSSYYGTATVGGASVNRVVIVAINSNGSSVSQAFNYTDQTVTQVYPWLTDGSHNLVQQAAVAVGGGQFTYTLPANSVISFVADCGSPGSSTPSPTRSSTFTPSPSATVTPTAIPTADACQSVIAVDCGSTTAYSSASLKLTFAADQQYVPGSAPGAAGSYGYVSWAAGTAYNNAGTITGGDAADAALYQYERYGAALGYAFSVPNGQAYVTFYWADTYATAAGQRIFSVTLNGTTILNNLDLYVASGGQGVTYSRTFPVTVSNGVISVMMTASTQNATLEGISVQAGPPCSAGSPTPSVTPTLTRSATASPTPTASSTATRTTTATLSATPSATPSATLTRSPVPSAMPTFTPSASPAASSTGTPSATATLSPPPSWTPSPAPSGSPTSTGTPLPSATATASVTPLSSASPTPAASDTASPGPSASLSPSPVLTATQTPADSVTVTFTVTATAMPTASPTAWPSLTVSATATPSASPTAWPSLTASATATPSATRSASPAATVTTTATPPAPQLQSLSAYTASAAGGLTLTVAGADFLPGSQVLVGSMPVQILSQSATTLVVLLAATAPGTVPVQVLNPDGQRSGTVDLVFVPWVKDTATVTPAPSGPLRIVQAWPYPNPGPHNLRLYVTGGADKVEVVVWSVALRRLASADATPDRDGWIDVPLPPEFQTQAASGAYYYSVQASRGSVVTPLTLGRFYRLH